MKRSEKPMTNSVLPLLNPAQPDRDKDHLVGLAALLEDLADSKVVNMAHLPIPIRLMELRDLISVVSPILLKFLNSFLAEAQHDHGVPCIQSRSVLRKLSMVLKKKYQLMERIRKLKFLQVLIEVHGLDLLTMM